MSGKKLSTALIWGIGIALLALGVLYVKRTYFEHTALVFDVQTIIEIAGSFVAGMIGGVSWQNKKEQS